jgi:hypothetical protein
MTLLHIYDISPRIKTTHLEYFLEPFAGEYVLYWVDESNALALFRSETLLRRALNELSGKEFKIKHYMDAHPEPDGSGFLILNSAPKKPPPQAIDPSEYRPTTKPAKVLPENFLKSGITGIVPSNSFEVLGEMNESKNNEDEEDEDEDDFNEPEKEVFTEPDKIMDMPQALRKTEEILQERPNSWEDEDV